jgi:transcriptional regulator with XRE-family HTH domain
VAQDWTAVARAIHARAAELDLNQKELAEKSGVSLAIVREIQQNRIHRRRNPRTLEALSAALGWHPDHLGALLNSRTPPHTDAPPAGDDPVVAALNVLVREIRALRTQVRGISKQIGAGGAHDPTKTEHP